MPKQTLYNKYRPSRFSEVIGQEYITNVLKMSIKTGKISNAYLFTGPRGTGKTTTARIFAKRLLCLGDNDSFDSCDECQSCTDFDDSECLDYKEIDAGSNKGIDNIRQVISWVSLPPQISKRRVVVIDEVHLLTKDAVSALLKTIEEPPESAVFILCTTDPQKVPNTIKSRCIWMKFSLIPTDEISKAVMGIAAKEGKTISEAAANSIAYAAEGGMRDALSMLEASMMLADDEITETSVGKVITRGTTARKEELLKYVVNNNMLKAVTFASSDDTSDDMKSLLLAVHDSFAEALLVQAGVPSDNETVSSIAQAISKETLVHGRTTIQKHLWKIDDARFQPKGVFADIMFMVLDPSCDPSYAGSKQSQEQTSAYDVEILASIKESADKAANTAQIIVKANQAIIELLKEMH